MGVAELVALAARALRADGLESVACLALAGSSSSLEESATPEERVFGVNVSSGDGERAALYGGGATLGVLSF